MNFLLIFAASFVKESIKTCAVMVVFLVTSDCKFNCFFYCFELKNSVRFDCERSTVIVSSYVA